MYIYICRDIYTEIYIHICMYVRRYMYIYISTATAATRAQIGTHLPREACEARI